MITLRPNLAGRSRAALGWAVAAFGMFQLGLLVCMELAWPQLRDLEFGRKLTLLGLLQEQQPDRPLLLMLGSSRTLLGFRAEVLDGLPDGTGQPLQAFNFGLTGAGPLRQWTVLHNLLENGFRPRRLLVEVMPPLLNEPGPGRMSEERWLEAARLSIGDLHRLGPYYSRRGRLWHHWLSSHLVPWYGQRYVLLWELDEHLIENIPYLRTISRMDETGWIDGATEIFSTRERTWFEQREQREYAQVFQDYRIGPGAERALRDLLGRCHQTDIEVALVLMPETSTFRTLYSAGAERRLQEFLTGLQESTGVNWIDARDWVPDAAFNDSHHLAIRGANVFSRRLRDELCLRPEIWKPGRAR